MINLTKLNKKEFFLNNDLIEIVEQTPDTLITLTTGKKILVIESGEEILEKIISFRKECFKDINVSFRSE